MNPTRGYFKNGQIWTEHWGNKTGDRHRLDGPATRWWYESGQLRYEEWCINGDRHRLDGPATRWWYEDGQLMCEEWWINGVEYKIEAEFQVAVDLYKANEIAGLF